MTEQQLCAAMNTHGNTVFRLALCRLQSIPDAEDVYQDVFLRLYQQTWAAEADGQHMKAWLIRTTINRCADMQRFRIRRDVISLENAGEVTVDEQQFESELWMAVNQLPAKFRVVVHLHYAEGYSTNEIAGILRIPAVTVRTRLRRARMKLKELLGGNIDG